jgi:hypothetical protein
MPPFPSSDRFPRLLRWEMDQRQPPLAREGEEPVEGSGGRDAPAHISPQRRQWYSPSTTHL